MEFDIKGMDVVVHRYKKNTDNCIQNWQNYDNIALEKLIKSVGCKAPYQETIKNWPICDSMDKMKKVIRHELRNYGIVPCREIQNIHYQISDSARAFRRNWQGKKWTRWFAIVWNFPNLNFTKTTSKKDVDLQSLIGWIGGYIGMFTGLSLAQIPELLFTSAALVARLRTRLAQSNSNEVGMIN